jgi:hypothetical protein
MSQPGPGGVLQFAEQVSRSRREDEYKNGVQSALEWVLGRGNGHPVAGRVTKIKDKPPNMSEIKRARGEARKAAKAGRQTPRVGPSVDYYKGVFECLHWISIGGPQPRRF